MNSTIFPSNKSSLFERVSNEIIWQEAQEINNAELFIFLEAIPDIVLVLNAYRQIIYSNRRLAEAIGIEDTEQLLGLRPGEALDCSHAFETESGCGTSESCTQCGALNAIQSSQVGKADIQEVRIIQKKSGLAMDLRVWATPVTLDNKQYTIFVVVDISNEKRRKVLERIFFHDLLNTAGGIQGLTFMLQEGGRDDEDEMIKMIHVLSEDMVRQIKGQSVLTRAENNEWEICIENVSVTELMEEIVDQYQHHIISKKRVVVMAPPQTDFQIATDRTLLGRVLGNLVKNAIEASDNGETITLACQKLEGERVEFSVHNQAVMPREVQLQIFQRSFSTRGIGRGLGTYSVKLLTENYLKGTVHFISVEGAGTTFYVRYALDLQAPKTDSNN